MFVNVHWFVAQRFFDLKSQRTSFNLCFFCSVLFQFCSLLTKHLNVLNSENKNVFWFIIRCIVLHQNFHRDRFALSGIGKKSICCLYFHYNNITLNLHSKTQALHSKNRTKRGKKKKERKKAYSLFVHLLLSLLVAWLTACLASIRLPILLVQQYYYTMNSLVT